MATQGRERIQRQNTARSGQFISGNTVRVGQTIPDRHRRPLEEVPQPRISNTTRKNREKARYMNLGYVLFLTIALLASGVILSNYLGLQADITNSVARIAQLEQELNNLRMSNDDEYNRITNSIDLEEIKRIALQELGMTYADEGQIIDYTSTRDDYVRQIADLPE
ncbi:MAG: cell division protein FtsL [Lachnospiraceae bacterium]|jgi:cell division protein FtsB|nr:cell division protein FtsL [Lachnospiraceae bacterium]